MNLTFALAIAPLFAKVYRLYQLVGSAQRFQKKTIGWKETATIIVPIVLFQVILLLIFTFVDPPKSVSFVGYENGDLIQNVQCQHDSMTYFWIQTVYDGLLMMIGCLLSFLSRNIDTRYGEAKQLLFGMYNVAFTGIVFICLRATESSTPNSLKVFRAAAIFWGTVITCCVFVVPRLLEASRMSQQGAATAVATTDGGARPRFKVSGMSINNSAGNGDASAEAERA
jgi:hypothetical protein